MKNKTKPHQYQTEMDLNSLLGIVNISATKYMNQYKKEHYDTIRFDVPKGTKAQLQAEAKKRDISLTELIKKSVEMYLQIR